MKPKGKMPNWYKKDRLDFWLTIFYITIPWIAFLIMALAYSAKCQPLPVPSYNLPESGHILEIGPNGLGTTWYSDHGREYTHFGSDGFKMQRETSPGNFMVWQSHQMSDAEVYQMMDRAFGGREK